jgi:hypothetical protein
MRSSVWVTDTTVNERIEHQQSCYGQEADHDNNLPRSLIRLEVEHFKAYSFDQDGASGRCRRRCAGTTDAPLEFPWLDGHLCPPNRGTSTIPAEPECVSSPERRTV